MMAQDCGEPGPNHIDVQEAFYPCRPQNHCRCEAVRKAADVWSCAPE